MWNALKSVLKRLRDRSQSDPEFEEVKGLVEDVLSRDYSSPLERKEQDARVIGVIERLNKEIESIRTQAKGYPDGSISGPVWLRGAGYANLCRQLTLHFRKADWLKREENASALWARATLAVCSHYHHMVGPAMLANADCQERLGSADRAAQMYNAIVADFEFLTEGDFSEGPIDEDERTALESLRTALRRLLKIGPSAEEKERLEQMRSTVEGILRHGSQARV